MKTLYFCDPTHSLYGKIIRVDIKHIKDGIWRWVSKDNEYCFNILQLRTLFEEKKCIILNEEQEKRYRKLLTFL